MRLVVGLLIVHYVLALSVPSSPLQLNTTEVDLQTDSFLQVSSSQFSLAKCTSYGDTHVNTFPSTPQSFTNVMGKQEWYVTQGPMGSDGRPIFSVQTTQEDWNTSPITANADVGIRCNNFYIMAAKPAQVGYPVSNRNRQLPTRLYFFGTDVNGRKYNGENVYIAELPANSPRTISFSSKDSITITRSPCSRNGCFLTQNIVLLEFTVNCMGSVTVVRLEQLWGGGSIAWIDVGIPLINSPSISRPSDLLVCSTTDRTWNTQTGGFCGCFKSDFRNNDAWTNWANCRPNEFKLATCNTRFIVPQSDSIFSMFEFLSRRAPGATSNDFYDAIFSQIATPSAKALLPNPDATVLETYRQRCRDQMSRVLKRTLDWSTKMTDPRTFHLDTLVLGCGDDLFYGADWSDSLMLTYTCGKFANEIDRERKDIFCAYKALDAKMETYDPRTGDYNALLSRLKSTADIQAVRERNDELKALYQEVTSSLDNINYWYQAECVNSIPNTENIVSYNCAAHQFVNSKDLSCPSKTPGINTDWDGTCTPGQKHGSRCTAKCGSAAFLFPPTSQVSSIQYTCTASAGDDGKIDIKWVGEGSLSCCNGTCPNPSQFVSSACQDGKYLCGDCPAGQNAVAPEAKSCSVAPCPTGSSNVNGICRCSVGYVSSNFRWDTASGSYLGSCVPSSCPTNSAGFPNCLCNSGFFGSIAWAGTTYTGTCTACSVGTNYASAVGQSVCTPCTVCNSPSETVQTECSATSNRVCTCARGFSGTPGSCQSCQSGFTFARLTGQESCSSCTTCNSSWETTATECTTTSDRTCQCKLQGVVGSCASVR